MASKSAIEKNNRRIKLAHKYAKVRSSLRKQAADTNLDFEKRVDARNKLALLPRNSNPTRIRNRCAATGRPRGYFRFFGLSRIALREMALKGELPGIRKASL